MSHRHRRHAFKALGCAVFCLLCSIASHSGAQDYFAGVRGGTSFATGNQTFYETETVVGMKLPWRWHFYSDWYLQPNVDLSMGCLGSGSTDGFIGGIAANLELRYDKFPVYLEGGFSPTVLSTYHYGAKNFGEDVQFTSHIGLAWDVTPCFTIGLRVQHMSNGRIAEPNPGLDMGEFSARFRF
jgi:hypothetical protein